MNEGRICWLFHNLNWQCWAKLGPTFRTDSQDQYLMNGPRSDCQRPLRGNWRCGTLHSWHCLFTFKKPFWAWTQTAALVCCSDFRARLLLESAEVCTKCTMYVSTPRPAGLGRLAGRLILIPFWVCVSIVSGNADCGLTFICH